MSSIKRLIFSRGVLEDDPIIPPEQPPLPGAGQRTGYQVWFLPGTDTHSPNVLCSQLTNWTNITTDYGIGVNHYNWLMNTDVYVIPGGAIRLYDAVFSTTAAPTGWYVFGNFPLGVPPTTPKFWVDGSGYINIKERCGY